MDKASIPFPEARTDAIRDFSELITNPNPCQHAGTKALGFEAKGLKKSFHFSETVHEFDPFLCEVVGSPIGF